MYDPNRWFWLADDGRVFSSEKQAIVTVNDPAYVIFLEANLASPWPRDDSNMQTDAALHDVLNQYSIFVNDQYYAANQRWLAESSGLTITGIAAAPSGMPVKTDDRSKNLIGLAGNAAQADTAYTTTWVAADGNLYALTNTEIKEMGKQVIKHVNDCFLAYTDAISGLKSKKIATRQQIDEAFARKR